MDNISLHMRITGLTVSDADVDSRRSAASKLSVAWGKIKTPDQIIAKAAEIAEALGGDGTPPASLGAEVEAVVQKSASAFLSAERPLEVGICSGVAAVSLISGAPSNHGWRIVDVYSNALWSALAFQSALADEKRERLRLEVLNLARDQSLKSAEKARDRDSVPDAGQLEVTWNDDDETTTTNFSDAISATVEALRRNAALDREELDFLWWAQLARSRALNRPLSVIAEPVRLVAAGIEGAKNLRRLPTNVHRDIVLRTVDTDPKLSLAELLAEIGEDRPALVDSITPGIWANAPTVFPLLNSLATGTATGPGEPQAASEWGARALLEAGLARMIAHGVIKQ